MIYNLVLLPIVGSIIGYITNWLAIKMLFKPYEKKFFCGIPVPFTPGLLAKERYRMSKNIGETVSEHLVTGDVIQKALTETAFTQMYDSSFDNFIAKIISDDYTVEMYIKNFCKLESTDGVKDSIRNSILKKLNTEEVQRKVIDSLCYFVSQTLKSDKTKKAFDENILHLLEVTEKICEEKISNIIEKNETLESIIGEENISKIGTYLEMNFERICESIVDFLNSEKSKDLDAFVVNLLKTSFDDKINMLVSTMIGFDNIYINIKGKLVENLSDNKEELFAKTLETIDLLVSKNIDELVNEKNKDYINEGIGFLLGQFGKSVENYDKSLYEFLEENNIDVEKKLKTAMESGYEEFLYNNVGTIDFCVNQIMNIKIGPYINNVSDENMASIKKIIFDNISEYSNRVLPKLIQDMNLSELVEEKINEMELEEIEDVVLSVASKELKSITMLGAVLGFVIAFIPGVIKMFGA